MDTPFAVLAQMLYGLVREESFRIEHTQWLAAQGQMLEPGAIELGGWKRRLLQLREVAALVTELAAHEAAIRVLLPGLDAPAAAQALPPTLWPDFGGEAAPDAG